MKTRKRFNRIRGWFPQEPYLISTKVKINNEKQNKPLVIPTNYKLSATRTTAASTIIWIVLNGFVVFITFNFISGRYPISTFQIAAWLIAGATAGLISCFVLTKKQLSRLSREHRIFVNGKENAWPIVLLILFFALGGYVSWFTRVSMGGLGVQGIFTAGYSLVAFFLITRTVLFAYFEKKENMRIMQDWFGPELLLIPKLPRNTANCLDNRLHGWFPKEPNNQMFNHCPK